MPSFSDSNRVTLRWIEEATWGTTPTGPSMTTLPLTSEGLKSDISNVTSQTIRSDKNISDITKVGGGASGPIAFEFSFNDFDGMMQGALQSTWATTVVSASIASAHYSGAFIQCDSSALNGIVDNQWLRSAESTTSANNGDWRVTDVSTETPGAGQSRVYLAHGSTGAAASFTSEVFAAGTTLKGRVMRNGTTLKSYSLEKAFNDIGIYEQFRGCRVADMDIALETESILTGGFSFMGKSMTITSTAVASATVAASSNPKMNASGNVARIFEGSDAVTTVTFKSLTMKVNCNTRGQAKIGSDALAGIATGVTEITGTVQAYFEDKTLVDKYLDATYTSLRFQAEDDNGKAYIFTIPRVKYTNSQELTPGSNNDIMVELDWGAVVDSTGTYALQIDRLD